MSGIYPYGSYTGDIVYEGEVCKFAKITDSEQKGIVIIHQELALVPYMTIGENMFLGNEQGKSFSIDWDGTYEKADKYLKIVGLAELLRTLIKTSAWASSSWWRSQKLGEKCPAADPRRAHFLFE